MYKIKYGYDTPVNRSLALTGIIAHPAGKNYGSVRLLSSGSTSVRVYKMGNIKLEYSTDNVIFADVTWTDEEKASVSPTFSLQDGESLYLKGNNTCSVSDLFVFSFSGVGTIAATGDIRAISTNSFCYSMFNGCTNLTTAPALPATTLANNCYNGMFNGCTKISSLAVYFTAFNQTLSCTTGWLEGVSTTGTFHCPSSLDTTTRDASHVPADWTILNN